jgi:hypothetical protein
MIKYFVQRDSYMRFDDSDYSLTTVTNSSGTENYSLVVTRDRMVHDSITTMITTSISSDSENGNLPGFAESNETAFNNAKNIVLTELNKLA